MLIASTPLLFPDVEHLGSATGFVDEIHEVIKSLALFDGFSKQECCVLCEYMECYGAPKRTTILKEGDPSDFLVIILTGQTSVLKADSSKSSVQVARLGPGGLLGEMSLFDHQPRFANCVTTEPTDFAVLTREGLNEILINHPRLGNKLLLILLHLMAERLRDISTRAIHTTLGVSI